jgi:hypothetical protein
MYILGFLSDGFGNKLYMLTYYIHIFFKIKKYKKIEKIYLVSYTSDHEKDTEKEKIYNIFPSLKKQKWLVWIDWDKYKTLKKNIKQTIIDTEIKEYNKIKLPLNLKGYIFDKRYFIQSERFFNKLYQFNSTFKKLNNNFDYNSIAIHIRLGDKIDYVYDFVIKGKKNTRVFAVYTPEFYRDLLKNFDTKIKVYIFTDSPQIFQKFYAKHIKHKFELVNVEFYEAFYLMSKFRNIIISESTLSIYASYLNDFNKKRIFGHKYMIQTGKISKITYIESNLITTNALLLNDTKYFLNENSKLLEEIYSFN